jgi:hypothetical protein
LLRLCAAVAAGQQFARIAVEVFDNPFHRSPHVARRVDVINGFAARWAFTSGRSFTRQWRSSGQAVEKTGSLDQGVLAAALHAPLTANAASPTMVGKVFANGASRAS